MQRMMIYLLSLLMTVGSFVPRAAGDQKVEQLLAQVRAALGGEKNLSKAQALTATGTYQRTMPDRQLSGEITIDLQLPDKMLRTESMSPMGDFLVITEQGLNGETLLRNQHAVNPPPGAVVRMGPAPTGDAGQQALRNARADFARTAIALLFTSPPSMPLDYTYGGEAESDDGKADVLEATGRGGFALKLFVDKNTHRPLMLAYRGVAPRVVIQTRQGPPVPDAAAAAGHGLDAAPAGSTDLVDIQWFLDDYKSVSGIMMPHHLARSVDGKPAEEMTFKSITLNPAFKPGTFAAK
jgi:hypothetical protein